MEIFLVIIMLIKPYIFYNNMAQDKGIFSAPLSALLHLSYQSFACQVALSVLRASRAFDMNSFNLTLTYPDNVNLAES